MRLVRQNYLYMLLGKNNEHGKFFRTCRELLSSYVFGEDNTHGKPLEACKESKPVPLKISGFTDSWL